MNEEQTSGLNKKNQVRLSITSKIKEWVEAESEYVYDLLLSETKKVVVRLQIQSQSSAVKFSLEYTKNCNADCPELRLSHSDNFTLNSFKKELKKVLYSWLERIGESYPLEINLHINSDRISSKIVSSNPSHYFSS